MLFLKSGKVDNSKVYECFREVLEIQKSSKSEIKLCKNLGLKALPFFQQFGHVFASFGLPRHPQNEVGKGAEIT